jgi:hypothetical protein
VESAPVRNSRRAVARRLGFTIALLALAMASCVTEVEGPQKPRPVKSQPTKLDVQKSSPKPLNSPKSSQGEPAVLPEGPVAEPAQGGATVASVRVTVVPLGTLEYDAQTLPLVSPDGRFLAAQQGQAPAWEAILGEDDAAQPGATRIEVYAVGDASDAQDGKGLTPVALTIPVPRGAVLGRDADDEGFLVEWPVPDGTRRIGKASWTTGEVRWIVAGPDVNAHGALLDDGTLVFSRRRPGYENTTLVLVSPDGSQHELRTVAPGEGQWCFPVPSSDPTVIFAGLIAQAADEAGAAPQKFLEVVAIRLRRGDGPPRFQGIIATRRIGPGDDLLGAYQALGAIQPSAHAGSAVAGGDRTGRDEPSLAFFHAPRGRVGVFTPRESTLHFLPKDTIAAARWTGVGERGWFCTTPRDLVFAPEVAGTGASARVLSSPYVARVVRDRSPTSGGRAMLLFGPQKRSGGLEVARLYVGGQARASER